MTRIYKITDNTNNKIYIGQTSRDLKKDLVIIRVMLLNLKDLMI